MPLPKRPALESAKDSAPLTPLYPSTNTEPNLPVLDVSYEEDLYDTEVYTPAPVVNTPVTVPTSVYDVNDDDYDDEEGIDSELEDELAGFSDEVVESLERLMAEILSDESSEVMLNGPNDVHYKAHGTRHHIPEIDFKDIKTYHQIINKFILPYTDTKERITENSHRIEGQLELVDNNNPDAPPVIARVHVMAPPVVKSAKVSIAKKSRKQFTVDDLVRHGSMSFKMGEFLKCASRGKLTMILSGVSGSGKTTLLEALSHHFDPDDRVIVVEDTPELRLPLADVVNMVSTQPKPGEDKSKTITLEWLVAQTNRMRPDRIIVGETRGGEMAEFLLAANSGADGSMTTIHANNPRQTLRKIVSLASRSVATQDERSINSDIASTVHLIIQTGLIDGQHVITHIEEVSNIIRKETGVVATTTLFEYDRRHNTYIPKARPSEQLIEFLENRGVNVDQGWFRQ